ncbi:MAG TPA: DUF4290 domain-containing protein [Cytophagaceae bacterium]
MMIEIPGYNQKGIVLKEYGRNIQKIVDYLLTIEDRDKRSRFAKTLIELMKQINPAMKDAQDYYGKLWDHLYIMSDFKLDVDSPYPKPEKSILDKKPMRVDYNMHNLHFKHYGRNIELLIQKAIDLQDPQEKEAAILYIGRLMKRFYSTWNKENIEDEVIVEHLINMSNGKLYIDVERVKAEGLFDSAKEYTRSSSYNSLNANGGNNNRRTINKGNNNSRENKQPRKRL